MNARCLRHPFCAVLAASLTQVMRILTGQMFTTFTGICMKKNGNAYFKTVGLNLIRFPLEDHVLQDLTHLRKLSHPLFLVLPLPSPSL